MEPLAPLMPTKIFMVIKFSGGGRQLKESLRSSEKVLSVVAVIQAADTLWRLDLPRVKQGTQFTGILQRVPPGIVVEIGVDVGALRNQDLNSLGPSFELTR